MRYSNRLSFVLGLFISLVGAPVAAEDASLSTRVPEAGLAVLDCAPSAPAPEESCVLRLPSGQSLSDLRTSKLGDQEASFRIVRGASEMPEGVVLSSTIVLVDLSRGPNGGRLNNWNRERPQILRLIDKLPVQGEIALFGFGADLQRLSGFSDDVEQARNALELLRPTEINTILSSNVKAAIKVLEGRERALLKNLIVISDGDEEGVGTFTDIEAEAARVGVTLSAVGMFWRAEGNEKTSLGLDVLNRLTRPQNGLTQPVFLRDASGAAASVDAFASQFSGSVARSGLILPKGTPAKARITVDLSVPVLGQPGRTTTETYHAQFTPAQSEEAPAPEPTVQENLLFGFPAFYVYIALGALLALLLGLGMLAFFKANEEDPEEPEGLGGSDDPIGNELSGSAPPFSPSPSPVSTSEPAPSAYLVRQDTGERLPIRGDRASLGRSSDNSIVLKDQGVSRRHAELHRNNQGGFSVHDLGSLNGTFVNDRKVSESTPLRIGDTVAFAKVRLKLMLP